MKHIVCLLVILSIVIAEFTYDGLNRLNKQNLDGMLKEKKTVLAMWYEKDCEKCGKQLWNINYSIFAFMNSKKLLVAAAVYDEEKELAATYSVPENHDSVEVRLFVDGNPVPLIMDEEDELISWISEKSSLKPQADLSYVVTDANYNSYIKKAKGKNVLFLFYVSADANSQSIINPFFQSALAFKSIKSLMFARVDCSSNRNICNYLQVQMIPSVSLIPNEFTKFDNKSLDVRKNERIDTYLNRYLGTFISTEGGLNEKYGREEVMDDLAHQFMNADNLDARKNVMKSVLKLKNSHPSAFRYYKIMKFVIVDGDKAVEREINETIELLRGLSTDEKEYSKLRAMQNVLTQFEKIEFKKEVFVLTSNNFDYVINGKRNVLVKFYAPWCGHCRALAPIYEEIAKEGVEDVVIAELDCDKYKDLAGRFSIEGFPTMKWFAKGEDPNLPTLVDSERTKESILGYIDVQLHGEYTPTPEPVATPEESEKVEEDL